MSETAPRDTNTEPPLSTPPRSDLRGLHIAFTGIDGSGKSLQAGFLRKALTDSGYVTFLFEGKEEFSINIMKCIAALHGVKSPREFFSHEVIDFLKAFDNLRDQVYTINPIKHGGGIVVVPRSGTCRIALAQAMGMKDVRKLSSAVEYAGTPELTIWIDVPANIAYERIKARGIDSEDIGMLRGFYGALEKRYEIESAANPHRWMRIDGTLPAAEVREDILARVLNYLKVSGRSLTRGDETGPA